MLDKFIPDMYYQSIYKIDYKKLKKMGVKCLLFDLDNTVAPYTKKEPDQKVKDLFAFLQKDFKIIIMSNSNKNRLRPFKEKLNVDTAYSSQKPLKKKYKKIIALYKFKPNQIAMIGDQLMTDILGGNRMELITIFVNPISKIEHLPTKINRLIERKIINHFNSRGILNLGDYYE